MARLKLGIVFGGRSEEHPVSVKSAEEVARNLDLEKYEPFWLEITKDGDWLLGDRPAFLSPGGLLILEDGKYETIGLDVVFPVLHGRFGEDGAIQGLLELAGIPYVGCDVPSSALCMDKSLAYVVAAGSGIA